MKRLIIFAAAVLLAACQPASTTANDVPEALKIATVDYMAIAKVCDAGRAVYVAFPRGGIAVVENAFECRPAMRP